VVFAAEAQHETNHKCRHSQPDFHDIRVDTGERGVSDRR
jgi:hypothetical protein